MSNYGLGSSSTNGLVGVAYGNIIAPLLNYNSTITTTGCVPLMPVNKNSYLIIQDGSNVIADVKDNLHDAQELARLLSVKHNTRFIIFKACWSCAPKADLNEEEL